MLRPRYVPTNTMSGSGNQSMLGPRYVPTYNEWDYFYHVFPEFPPTRTSRDPWLFEERVIMAGPYGLQSFPGLGAMPFVDFDNNTAREDYSKLTPEAQERALKKLKKEIYNPMTKRMTRRLSLYYRDNAKYLMNESKERDFSDDDEKRCAICLEDFETRQEVMVTPCNHMFHEDCIVPWVKSNGQCPVCRYSFC